MSITPGRAAAWFEDRAKNTPMPATREMFKIAGEAIREKGEREDPRPLTIEELHNMIGEPVYIVGCGGGHWEIFAFCNDAGFWCSDASYYLAKSYGKTWHALRHKPNEV